MANIFDLKQQQQELLDELYWVEEGSEKDILESRLQWIEGSVERKLSYLSDVLAEAIALSQLATERRKIAQERLERKEKQAQRAEEKLREFILSVMTDFDIKSVKGDLLNVSRYERDVVIQTDDFDIEKLPSSFYITSKTILKGLINQAIKDGEEVPGFETVKKETLRVS